MLVVGGGEVAARKIDLLLRAGARSGSLHPSLYPGLAERAAAGEITHRRDEFRPEHLDGVRLAIAATDKHAINAWVARQAERRNIPVNVVDDRELSRFIVPAIVDRSPVVVAVGSSGDAPVLTRRLRERLESFLPQRLGALAKLAGTLRPHDQDSASAVRRAAGGSGRTSSTARSPPMCSRAGRCARIAAMSARVVDSSAQIAGALRATSAKSRWSARVRAIRVC